MIRDVAGPVDIVGLIRTARSEGRVRPPGAGRRGQGREPGRASPAPWPFPQWFGANLDALADCARSTFVTEVATPVEVIWDGVTTLADEDPSAYDGIHSVLVDVAQVHRDFHVTVVHRL